MPSYSLLVVPQVVILKHIDRNFADDILKCIFVNKKVWISIEISLIFFLMVQTTICRTGDDQLSARVIAWFTDAYMRHSDSMS